MAKEIFASHTGELVIGKISIPCHVLDNAEKDRVFSGRGMQNSLGFPRTSSGLSLSNFVQSKLISFLSIETLGMLENPLTFRRIGSGGSAPVTFGYDATILIDICDAIIQANRNGDLTEKQEKHAISAEIIIRSVAKIGVIALVDEATGYQEVRKKDELAKILEGWIEKEEARRWVKTFPMQFYEEIFRLKGWDMLNPRLERPGVVGKYTNDIVYERIAPELLTVLQKKNPSVGGKRKTKHHQWLTGDIGEPSLKAHLEAVVALMKVSNTWDQFKRHLQRVYPKFGTNLEIDV